MNPELDSVLEDLKAFVDGELSPERAKVVQAAIDQNLSLRQEVEFMKTLSGEIKSSSVEPSPKGLEETLSKVRKPVFVIPLWSRYVAAAACGVFMIGLFGQMVFQPGSSGGSETSAIASKTSGPMAGKSADIAPSESESKGETSAGHEEKPAPTAGGEGLDSSVSSPPAKESDVFALRKPKYEARTQSPSQTGSGTRGSTRYVTPPPTVKEGSRHVIRNANMGIKVKDVQKAVSDTTTQVMAMGGIVDSSNYTASDETSGATVQFSVPEKNFNAILDTLRKMGRVIKDQINSQDVTHEIADGDGRINALADEEANLISELSRTRDSYTRLEIRQRLSNVRQEIESIKEQNKATRGLAAMSSVTVEFQKTDSLDNQNSGWIDETTKGASGLLGFFGRVFGVGLIYTVMLAPVWLPIVAIAWWLKRKSKVS